MGKFIDLTGQRFGRLTVIARDGNIITNGGRSLVAWNCICDCGNKVVTSAVSLSSRKKKSCGCLRRETSTQSMRKIALEYPHAHPTHGESKNRLFRIWDSMKYRCHNPRSKSYVNYGGRGIQICSEWDGGIDGYTAFKSWALSNGYDNNLSLDRIDNNGDYEPSNCRWANAKIQSNNTRRNRYITWDGQTRTLTEWSDALSIPMKVLHDRIHKSKWSIERAFSTPYKDRHVYINFKGDNKTITEWARGIGIDICSLQKRIRNGWGLERALTEPRHINQVRGGKNHA